MTPKARPKIIVRSNLEELSRSAVRKFIQLSNHAISKRGVFRVALSGGKTPQKFHRLLAQKKLQSEIRWEKIDIFFSDERSLPYSHKESNYGNAYRNLISKIKIPGKNVHPAPIEGRAALKYENEIKRSFGIKRKGIPVFDVIFLGVGEDGHTASLFCGDKALNEKKRLVARRHGRETGIQRITFTLPLINRGRCVIFLVSGKSKSRILNGVLKNKKKIFPAGLVKPAGGNLIWLVDRNAFHRPHL